MDYKYEDEDFTALEEARRKRANTTEDDAITLEQICADNLSFSEVIDEICLSTDKSPQDTKLQSFGSHSLRTALFEADDRDDKTVWETLTNDVAKHGLTLSDEEVRRYEDNMTVLHYALENERWNVARYLIAKGSEKLLTDEYNVTVDKMISRKSCLHILAEKGNLELAKLLLERLTIDARKKELYKIVTQFESQRQRRFNCMHLAALNGHTNLIELFHAHGVDVNINNDKYDTPVLLAVRGNHIEAVRKLIELEANLEQEDDEKSTPLYCAVRYGFVDIVKILLNEGKVNVYHERLRGFVTPIVLACALGYHDIVEILLEKGADASVRISNDQTALHLAAAEGNNRVIQVLLDKGKADVSEEDVKGNTALLLAAKAGNIVAMYLLVPWGANIDCKNKMGQTIWDHAVCHPKIEFLKAVAKLYRRAKRFSAGKLTFVEGIYPLHAAASNGDVEKMSYLLGICENRKARDQSGNTFFHIAAKDGCRKIIEALMSDVDVNCANNDGDTALHLACKSGHIETTQILVQKAKLEAKNKLGMTPLHVAVASDAVSPELIRILVDWIVNANKRPLLDTTDHSGNTALHIAVKHRNTEILHELRSLDPKIENRKGDTPFHVAAESGINLETMIDIFHNPEKGVNIDQKNKTGESCLHVCARRGNIQSLGILVNCGANLELRDGYGNTVIHAVIEESVQKPEKKEALLEVFRGITRVATLWWCKKEKLNNPKEDTDEYYKLLRIAMLHLTSKVYNKDGLNAVTYAITNGAVELLEEILNTPNVYRLVKDERYYLFDITDFVPETTAIDQQRLRKTSFREAANEDDNDNEKQESKYDKSYLDLILLMEDDSLVSKILDVNPFKQFTIGYPYQFFYGAMMLIHIVYMSLFGVYVLPFSDDLHLRYNSTNVSGCQSGGTSWVYGLFLIWPGLILLFQVYSIVTLAWKIYYSEREVLESIFIRGLFALFEKMKNYVDYDSYWLSISFYAIITLYVLYEYLTNIETLISLAFVGLAIAWYVLFQCPSDMSTYVEIVSMVLVIGWLYTIIFTKGFERMHSYSIMLKRIIKQDITRYLIMYVFFLLGCGMAFNALFQIVPSSGCTENSYFHASVWLTLFDVFGLMMGLGSLFDESFDECYKMYGGNPTVVRCLYVFYIVCTTIILVNLLISMMSDTYTNIKAEEETTWKQGSLRLARRIERSLPFVNRFRQGRTRDSKSIFYDYDANRWMIEIPHHKIEPFKARERDELLITVQQLKKKMDELQDVCVELSNQMKTMQSSVANRSSAPVSKRPRSFYDVVNQVRRRSAATQEICERKEETE